MSKSVIKEVQAWTLSLCVVSILAGCSSERCPVAYVKSQGRCVRDIDATAIDAAVLSSVPPVLSVQGLGAKNLAFSWEAVGGVAHFQLFADALGTGNYVAVSEELDAKTLRHEHVVSVHSTEWDTARYKVRACSAQECIDSNVVSAANEMLDVIGYIKASNTEGNDNFGSSVALSADGLTLAIGAPWEDSKSTGVGGNQADNSATNAGAVYVFVNGVNGWTQQAYIKASNVDEYDRFGQSVALAGDGNTLAVAALHEDSNATGVGGNAADNSSEDAGAVYMFARTEGGWTQQAYVKASTTDSEDLFGYSVSLSEDGTVLAVGAFGEDSDATGIGGDQSNNNESYSGAVYVFTRDTNSWTQQAYIKASNTDNADYFGCAVSLDTDGNTLAVGAWAEESNATGINGNQADNSLSSPGAAYVFVRNGSNWTQQAYVKASNTNSQDEFGVEVALSADGNTLAVSAIEEDGGASGIDGDETNNSFPDAGAAYIFVRDGTTWAQQAYIKATNPDTDDYFGGALALSSDGKMLGVRARGEDSDAAGVDGDQSANSLASSGAVYVYARNGDIWHQQAYVKAPNPDEFDEFGNGLALSADGSMLAVGSRDDSSAKGIGGDQSDNSADAAGAVFLY